MSAGWEMKKLGEVSKVNYGYTEKASFEEIGPRFLRITDIQNNHVDWETVPFCKIEENKMPKYLLGKGDIVFARTGATTGKSFLINDPPKSVFASYLIRLKILNQEELLPEFLYAFFQTKTYWDRIEAGTSGSAQGGFNASKLSGMEVPIPPIEEQRRIVAMLDEALAGVQHATANTERNLANTQELFNAHLQAIFANPADGWEVCAIDDYVNFIDYRGKTPKKTQSGLRLITAKNVKPGVLQREPEEFVNPDTYDSWMTRGIPNKGDVLFTTEAPLGNVAQLDTDEKVVLAQRIITMQPQIDKIDQTFLKYLLMSQPIQQKILEKGTGATVKGIKSKLLKKIEIYFPKPLDEQRAIVAQLDALAAETQRLQAIYQQKLAALQELKQAILQQAFTPNTKVRRTSEVRRT